MGKPIVNNNGSDCRVGSHVRHCHSIVFHLETSEVDQYPEQDEGDGRETKQGQCKD